MEITVSPHTWIRNRRQTNGYGGLSIAFGVFWAALTIYFLTQHHHGQGAGTKIGVAAIASVLAVGFTAFGVRQLRSGLWIASDRVIVRGPLRVRCLATEDVTGFFVGRTLAPCAVLRQSAGGPVPITALMSGGLRRANEPAHAKELEPICKQLDALLASVQDKSPSQLRAAGRATSRGPTVGDRDLRVPLIATLAVFWLVAIGVIILASRSTVTVFVVAIVLIDTGWTVFALRRARRPRSAKKPRS